MRQRINSLAPIKKDLFSKKYTKKGTDKSVPFVIVVLL